MIFFHRNSFGESVGTLPPSCGMINFPSGREKSVKKNIPIDSHGAPSYAIIRHYGGRVVPKSASALALLIGHWVVPCHAQQIADFAASCAPNVAGKDLAAIAQIESSLNPLAIHDNTSRKSYAPPDKTVAIEFAQQLLRAGHSIDVGLMQVNSANFGWLGLTLADAFDGCSSLRAGAQVLTAFSRYNTGSSTRGFSNGYVARVLAAKFNPTGTLKPDIPKGNSQKTEETSLPTSPFVNPARTMPEMVFNVERK